MRCYHRNGSMTRGVSGLAVPLRLLGALLLLVPGTSGCLAFARGQAGNAYSSSDTPGHSGPVVGADAVLTAPRLRWLDGKSAFPFGVHNSFETVLAPERKDFAWGTGLAYFGSPRPASGHVIVGTNAHIGEVDGRLSVGNISPYVVLGVRAALESDPATTEGISFLSLDVSGQTYIDYLSDDELVTTLICLKFGAGWGY